MKTTHASLRALLALGLEKSESAEPQMITRTVKLRIGAPLCGEDGKIRTACPDVIHLELNRHFDAVDTFRHHVLDELGEFWERDPNDFAAMVGSSAAKPFEGKSGCFGWLSTRFVTGRGDGLAGGVSPQEARSILNTLAGGLKSFLTRRKNVLAEIRQTAADNEALWSEKIAALIAEHDLATTAPPGPPPKFDNITVAEVEQYNAWVGRARVWGNLILHQQLVQKDTVTRDDAKLPRRLKGYPGFPGSQRYGAANRPGDAMRVLEGATRHIVESAPARFAELSTEHWAVVRERFTPLSPRSGPPTRRPRFVKALVAERLHYLIREHTEWTPAQVANEVLAGLFRLADKLRAHLDCQGIHDRSAIMRLADTYNVASVFALEPLRVRGEHGAYYDLDEPRRLAFANLRGALTEPGDDTAAMEIPGFSLPSGKLQYRGLLACRESQPGHHEWAFFYALRGQDVKIIPESLEKAAKGWKVTDWSGFATAGGDASKRTVRGAVWLPADGAKAKPALALPLAFGVRQGREYFWHFDRDLRTRDEWTPLNARLLRVMPPNRPDMAKFFVSITFSRLAPPLGSVTPAKFVGIDRGEAVPAAYAVIDTEGRFLADPNRLRAFDEHLAALEHWEHTTLMLPETQRDLAAMPRWKTKSEDGFGFIAPEYREQQRRFNDTKRELQRTRGGYTRKLRATERNRARVLGGQVARELLALAASHQAPLVFEALDSAIATRGGRGTMMSQMQYTRMFSAVEQKLAEAGLCEIASQPKFRKWDNGFIKLVGPAYTSATCSDCGHVHSTEFYEKTTATLHADGGLWYVILPNGQSRPLAQTYTYYVRGQGEKTGNTDERIRELLNKPTFAALSKTNRSALVSLLRNRWLPYRPTQARFQCVCCGHSMNADLQAALNIARKHLFRITRNKKPSEDTESARRRMAGEWETWYRGRVTTVWRT